MLNPGSEGRLDGQRAQCLGYSSHPQSNIWTLTESQPHPQENRPWGSEVHVGTTGTRREMSHPEPSSVHALWAGALSTQLNLRRLRQASFIPAGSTEHTEGVRGRQKRTRWPELTGAARASSCHLAVGTGAL